MSLRRICSPLLRRQHASSIGKPKSAAISHSPGATRPGYRGSRFPFNRVRWWTQPYLIVLVFGICQAEPLVPGFERFHSDLSPIESGAILFSELGCANCHGGSDVLTERQGPTLAGISDRLHRDWVVGFLRDPESKRSGSPMPQMFHGLEDDEIDAVVAYLGTLGPGPKLKSAKYVNAERGSAHFHEKGCIACHAPSAESDVADSDKAAPWAVPHPNFREKMSFDALTAFLSDPTKIRPDGRMPHFELDSYKVGDIAAHLYDFQGSDPGELKGVSKWPEPGAEKVKSGEDLYKRLNCAACHDPKKEVSPIAIDWKNSGESHCFGSETGPDQPHYPVSEKQRVALSQYIESKSDGEPDKTKITLAAMNCYACHERDGIGGPSPETAPFFHGDEALADSGRFPPPLTGIGHKLERDWMEGVFRGKEGSRVRPYLKTQMPVYSNHAKLFADWFSKIDAEPDAEKLAMEHADLDAGQTLLGTVGGVNCITCHTWGEQPSLGIQALDIANLDGRLRPEWFRSYLLNPAKYRPGTLMPPLWPGGHSTVPGVLGGDTEKQIASIWKFIAEGEGLPPGFPEGGSSEFDLVPTDRPIVMRTFLEGAGTKAILAGFPGEIHIAYDGNEGRPALVWRGQFFNAYQTWYSRSAPIEKPLGEEIYPFGKAEGESEFCGYLLDKEGNPEFLIEVDGREISDHFEVVDEALIRRLSWEKGGPPEVTHPDGVEVQTKKGEKTLTFIYSWK